MSVPAWRRDTHVNGKKKGYLDVTISAEKLLLYTVYKVEYKEEKIINGETKLVPYFHKSETFTKKIPIIQIARKIYHELRKANRLRLDSEYEKRHDLQIETLLSVEEMLALLTEYDSEHIIANLKFWVGLIEAVEIPLCGWIKSDKDRHDKLLSTEK